MTAASRLFDPDTAIAAGKPDRTTDREKALRWHQLHPWGLTDFELADLMGRQQTSAGKRRCELRDAGLVEDSGLRRRTPSGASAIVWRLVTHSPAPGVPTPSAPGADHSSDDAPPHGIPRPTWADVAGKYPDFTGGLTPTEYVRRQRR